MLLLLVGALLLHPCPKNRWSCQQSYILKERCCHNVRTFTPTAKSTSSPFYSILLPVLTSQIILSCILNKEVSTEPLSLVVTCTCSLLGVFISTGWIARQYNENLHSICEQTIHLEDQISRLEPSTAKQSSSQGQQKPGNTKRVKDPTAPLWMLHLKTGGSQPPARVRTKAELQGWLSAGSNSLVKQSFKKYHYVIFMTKRSKEFPQYVRHKSKTTSGWAFMQTSLKISFSSSTSSHLCFICYTE